MREYKFFMFLCKAFSIIFFIMAIVLFINDINFLAHSTRTKAKIMDTEDNKPRFEFKDQKGHLIRGRALFAGKYGKGESLDILYLPEKPENCCVDSFLNIWLGPFFCTIFAILCLIDVVILYYLKKLKSKLCPTQALSEQISI